MPPTLEEDGREYNDDTIVVKSENFWSRQSSPDRMSSESDINSLLTHINYAPQHLESPEPVEQDTMNPAPGNTFPQPNTRAPKYPGQRPRTSINATQEEKLIMMPEKRPLPWRDGVEPGAENETGGESRRKQIRFGCLLATRGEIQKVQCNSCNNGRGKFRFCIALDGFFKGACASCQLSGRPNRCSIKKNDDDAASSPNTLHVGGEASSRLQQPQPASNSEPQTKRRKTHNVPEWESARPQWEQELGDAQARQVMNDRSSQHWASVNPPVPAPNPNMVDEMNGSRSVHAGIEHRTPMSSWAPVNQSVSTSTPHTNAGPDSGGGYRSERTRRESTMAVDDGSVTLIDTLPKNKQRQVYGLVSGIQGGIDHLQRELDSLKKALGIDDGD